MQKAIRTILASLALVCLMPQSAAAQSLPTKNLADPSQRYSAPSASPSPSAPALASPAPAPSQASPASGGVPILSGGVGEEMDHIRSVQNQYSLKLMFIESNGLYLSEVPVKISDRKGDVLVDTVTTGPVLLAKLPPGTYKVTASQLGVTKEGKVKVGSGLTQFKLLFPAVDANEG